MRLPVLRGVGESVEAIPSAAERNLETRVEPAVDAFTAVETRCLVLVESIGHAVYAVVGNAEVRDASLSRADGQIEHQAIALEGADANLSRLEAPTHLEDLGRQIAPVGEVPEQRFPLASRG